MLFSHIENCICEKLRVWSGVHPYLTCLLAFIGMPVLIVITGSAVTASVILPVSLLFGWL